MSDEATTQLLNRLAQHVPASSAPLEQMIRDGARLARHRRITTGVGAAASVAVLATTAAVLQMTLQDGTGTPAADTATLTSPQPTASTTPTSPPAPTASAPVGGTCNAPELSTELARTGPGASGSGAWHGLVTQLVVIRNDADQACTLHGSQLQAALVADHAAATVDVSAIASQELRLRPGRGASVLIGEPQKCSDVAETHGRLQLTVSGRPLRDVAIPYMVTGCGQPRTVGLVRAPAAPPAIDFGSLPRLEAQAMDQFIRFARQPDRGGPFDTPVSLGVGGYLVKTISAAELTNPAAWNVSVLGYAQRGGRASPLNLIRTADGGVRATTASVGFCGRDGALSSTPLTDGGIRFGIVPRNYDDCTNWWQIDLYVNDVGQITSVDMFLGGP